MLADWELRSKPVGRPAKALEEALQEAEAYKAELLKLRSSANVLVSADLQKSLKRKSVGGRPENAKLGKPLRN